MPVKAGDERGFTMIMTVIGITLVVLLATVAVTAVNGSTQAGGRDLQRKQAYEAALAGLNEYAYHLHANSSYWTKCTEAVPATEKSALNQKGSTANRRPVPGGSGATYALELMPSTGYTSCNPTNVETATASMLEGLEPLKGTFRVRATGFFGPVQVKVTATFKPASFLDYVYFTQLETSDPVTYGNPELIKAAQRQCIKPIYPLNEGRYAIPLENERGQFLNENGQVTTRESEAEFCDVISFVGADNVKGPMHTNDAFVFCGSPTLGRRAEDPIEVSYPEKPGWFQTKKLPRESSYGCSGSSSNVKGTYQINAPALIPPESNSELATIAEPAYRFSGEVSICLEGTTMRVGAGKSCGSTKIAFPPNGVIYVSNKNNECKTEYTPFNVAYETTGTNTCGNVNIVEGKYAKPLTIAAANNVLIKTNVEKTTEEGMLGLIATNFIRVYHPIELVHPRECDRFGRNCTENLSITECGEHNATGAIENLKIEAALLALQHSFIVDNYKCGDQLGSLSVIGAIAQKYRGAVGTTGNSGYVKNYEYDERLKTTEPPSFIEPIKSDWVIGRETTE